MSLAAPNIVEVFIGLRNQAFSIDPSLFGNETPSSETELFAAMMEFGSSGTIVTLLAVIDGTTSLYFGNGGGLLGAGRNAEVRKNAVSFIDLASQFIPVAEVAKSFPLPNQDCVNFWMIGRDAVYGITCDEEELGSNTHVCSKLFFEGHKLMEFVQRHSS